MKIVISRISEMTANSKTFCHIAAFFHRHIIACWSPYTHSYACRLEVILTTIEKILLYIYAVYGFRSGFKADLELFFSALNKVALI